MSEYLPAAPGTVLLVRVVDEETWRRWPIIGWEVRDPEDPEDGGPDVVPLVAAGGASAEPWSREEMFEPIERLRVSVVVEIEDCCGCDTPRVERLRPQLRYIACSACGLLVGDRWDEASAW